MVCQICGKKSGYYPLCNEHFKMRDQGLVVKCADCNMWHIKADGCSTCKHDDEHSGEIMFQRELLEHYGKRLFRIVKQGEVDSGTDYDLDCYEDVMQISGELMEYWKDLENSVVYLSETQISQWFGRLDEIAKDGLHHSDDKFDIARYVDILGIAEELREAAQSYSMELENIPEADDSSSDVEFIADHDTLPRLLKMIGKAESTILIASPWIWGIREIENKLTEVKDERNVSIRILTRQEEDDVHHGETVRGLHKRGFGIETAPYLHPKIVHVYDNELYIGSANLVKSSMKRNLEAGVCTNHPRTVSQALVYFQEKFDEAFERRFTKSTR
ncbi:MAG: NUDIX hydrolase N-terminal domain-containing protein [Candidatus Thorarchaeota archaeon]